MERRIHCRQVLQLVQAVSMNAKRRLDDQRRSSSGGEPSSTRRRQSGEGPDGPQPPALPPRRQSSGDSKQDQGECVNRVQQPTANPRRSSADYQDAKEYQTTDDSGGAVVELDETAKRSRARRASVDLLDDVFDSSTDTEPTHTDRIQALKPRGKSGGIIRNFFRRRSSSTPEPTEQQIQMSCA